MNYSDDGLYVLIRVKNAQNDIHNLRVTDVIMNSNAVYLGKYSLTGYESEE